MKGRLDFLALIMVSLSLRLRRALFEAEDLCRRLDIYIKETDTVLDGATSMIVRAI